MAAPKRVSQQSLAADLGVSQALVSLTLNGRSDRINPETYKRIWDHAIKAGYQPKGIKLENSPADTRTRQIGIIQRSGLNLHTQGSYFAHVMHGLHSAVLEHGFTTSFFGGEDNLDADRLAHYFGPAHAVSGVILMGEVKAPFLERLRAHTRRIVAVSARYPGYCHSVLGNEPQALADLVQHLHELGHRRIGWIGGNLGLGRHEMRLQAFKFALKTRDLQHNPRYDSLWQQGDRAEGSEAMLKLLTMADRRDFPSAFVTYNTHMAIGAIRVLQRDGRHVPADISVAAADYSHTARMFNPRITAAGCDPDELGRSAANLLLRPGDETDGSFTDLVLASQLHLGESTGPAT